jgi:hypothetical protein
MRRVLALSLASLPLLALLAVGCQSADDGSARTATWSNPYPHNSDPTVAPGSNARNTTAIPPATQPAQ